LPFRIPERLLSGASDAFRVIELTSARLRKDIDGLAEVPGDVLPAGRVADPPASAWHDGPASKAPADPGCRLRLLRAAWGPGSHPLSSGTLQSLAAGLPADVALDLTSVEASCVFPPLIGRIVLNLLLLAAESLPMGGTIRLAGSADDLFLQIAGVGAAWPAGMAVCAVDEGAAVTAITDAAMTGAGGVQMPLTALLAHTSGVRLSFLLSSSSSRGEPPMLRVGGG
jgi:histidine phosphotransferase ChpT